MKYDDNQEGIMIVCAGCQTNFLFTDSERTFFESKGYTQPKRCKPCRELKKKQIEENSGKTQARIIS